MTKAVKDKRLPIAISIHHHLVLVFRLHGDVPHSLRGLWTRVLHLVLEVCVCAFFELKEGCFDSQSLADFFMFSWS